MHASSLGLPTPGWEILGYMGVEWGWQLQIGKYLGIWGLEPEEGGV